MSVGGRDGLDHLDAKAVALPKSAEDVDVPRSLPAKSVVVPNQ
jgi:hypothetical protein